MPVRFVAARRRASKLAGLLVCGALALQSCGGNGNGNGNGNGDGGGQPPPATIAGNVSLLAGSIGGAGNLDGAGSQARFNGPYGLALDASGHLYVADTWNALIRKVTPAGAVSTVVGAGRQGFADGPAGAATFCLPGDLALDPKGNVFVGGLFSPIRRIAPDGSVATLTRGASYPCSIYNPAVGIPAGPPQAIATDSFGNLYVGSQLEAAIHKIDAAGSITLFASATQAAPAGSSRLAHPQDLAVDAQGNVYASGEVQQGRERFVAIQKITPSGAVSTLVDLSAAGVYFAPRFALDMTGNVYLADAGNSVIRKLSPTGAARFRSPFVIAASGDGSAIVVGDGIDTIRRIDAAGNVTTLAGLAAPPEPTFGRFHASDRAGNVFVTVRNDGTLEDHALQRIAPDGTVTTLLATGLQSPSGIAVDRSGNVYVADESDTRGPSIACPACGTPAQVLRITPQGRATTLAGALTFDEGRVADIDAIGSQAVLRSPAGLAIDGAGDLYLAQRIGASVRRITRDGVVTTPPVSLPAAGALNPRGIAADQDGNLYLTSCSYATGEAGLPAGAAVFKIRPDGSAALLAGSLTDAGYVDGRGAQARFNSRPIDGACLQGIAVDAAGNAFVADGGNDAVRKIAPDGQVSTLAGQAGKRGITLGALPATLSAPTDLSLDAAGRLYVGSAQAILRVRFGE